jgi:hypothetical protein
MAPGNLPGTNWGNPFFLTSVGRQVLYRFDTPNGNGELWSFFDNKAPDCAGSRVTPDLLWPPNHKMAPVAVLVSDPDDDPVAVDVTSVFTDEPTSLSGYDPSPDAVILGDSAHLRKERNAHGNGRVYTVSWSAVDPFGATCEASGLVCVPRDRGNSVCGYEGALYDATQP